MNILVYCPYDMYSSFSNSFVHMQTKTFVTLGHHVDVIVPIAFGRKKYDGKRFDVVSRSKQDGVNINYVRYFSLSKWGSQSFNQISAKCSAIMYLCCQKKKMGVDIVHIHTVGFGGRICRYIKRCMGLPIVMTTHGGDTVEACRLINYKRTKQVLATVDVLVTVSSKLQRMISEKYDFDRCKCILNGFDDKNIKEKEKTVNSVIQVGHLIPLKHVDISLSAIKLVRDRGINLSFYIVGNGPEKERLQMIVSQLDLDEFVRFIGEIDNSEVLELMSKSEFFVMPSYPEGFGIVYLEAMASGCVTIGTKGEGIEDVIVTGENGYLVEKDDAEAIADYIDYCIKNPEKKLEISKAARKTAMQYTWKHNASQYIELFENCRIRSELYLRDKGV